MGVTLWFTGLPSIGKSTIAKEVVRHIEMLAKPVALLESDQFALYFAHIQKNGSTYRKSLLQSMAVTALYLNRQNIIAVCTATSPDRTFRQRLRRQIPDFLEIYCRGDIETAQERDYRGLYDLARQGFIENFTGVDTIYEAPENAELTLDTLRLSPTESADKVLEYLKKYAI